MELPPRKQGRFEEVTIQRNRSSLEVLMQMGFSKLRAEKALAATGDKGVQLASDWLLSHVNDPLLDERVPREYILYLCPVGQLQQQLLEFWHRSYARRGWNRAHNFFPHITLCSFFKADDSSATPLAHALKTVGESMALSPNALKVLGLEYFSSTNFIGLFVSEQSTPFLKQLTQEFAEEAKKMGVTVEPHKKQLHVSLAYQFPTEMKEKLETLAKEINVHSLVRWDIRLYSRDYHKGPVHVRKVLYTHIPRAPDELEMIDGDFAYVEESEIENTPDGWCKGTSWLTGVTAMFPLNYTERTAETETWTMHRSIPIIGTDVRSHMEQTNIRLYECPASLTRTYTEEAGSRIIAATRSNRNFADMPILRGTETLPPRLPEMTTIRNLEMNGPITADNILYATVGDTMNLTNPPAPPSAIRQQQQQHQMSTPTGSPKMVRRSASQGSPKMPRRNVSGSNMDTISSSSSSSSSNSTLSTTKPVLHQLDEEAAKFILSLDPLRDPTPTKPQPPSEMNSDSNKVDVHQQKSWQGEKSKTLPRLFNNGTNRTTRPPGPRQLYVIRHGERVDFTFGKEWIQQSFDQAGNYIRHDLNMPHSLPKRKGGPNDFSKDAPLTVQGMFQSRVVGEALNEKDVPITHVYASPSLRCVETAMGILEGMGDKVHEIHIEPGLFEWLGWYTTGLPRFLTPAEYRDNGYKVSNKYQPLWSMSKYNVHETTEQYYERCYTVTKEILKRHEADGGSMLFVAHAASLDTCTRQLTGHFPRNHVLFHDILHKIPYLAMSVCQEDVDIANKWIIIEPPVLSFAHTNNPKYNWSVLMIPSLI